MPSVLLDTGPLVALFRRADKHHPRSVEWFKAHRGPLLTTQAVVTEAWHLLSQPARLPLVRFVTASCEVYSLEPAAHARVLTVLEHFQDLPMDYTDATLLVLGEVRRVASVATIDVKDFSAYRLPGGKALRLVF